MKHPRLAVIALAVMASSSVLAVAQEKAAREKPAVSPEPVRILCLGDLAGHDAQVLRGLRVGLVHVAAERKSDRWLRPFEFMALDNHGDAKKSLDLLETALGKGRVDILLTPGATAFTQQMRQRLRKLRIPVLAVQQELPQSLRYHGLSLATPVDLVLARLVEKLVADGMQRFGVFYSKGRPALRGIAAQQLRAQKANLVGVASHEAGDRDVAEACQQLAKLLPDCVLLLGEPASNLRLIKRMQREFPKLELRYAMTDRIDEAQLVAGLEGPAHKPLAGLADGLLLASGLPWPWADWLPIVEEWNRVQKAGKEPAASRRSFRAFEGYAALRFLQLVVDEEIGGADLHTQFVAACQSARKLWDLDGIRLSWPQGRRFGSSRVWLSVFSDGKLQELPDEAKAIPGRD